jgi:serine/threonine-protein kinase
VIRFVLSGIAVAAVVALFFLWRNREAPTRQLGAVPDSADSDVVEFDVQLGASGRSLGSDWGNDVILSPDGRRIVFVARGSDHVLRLMTTVIREQRTVTELRETEGARAPFFSPNGRWVGFWADGRLKKVAIDGGSPDVLTDAIHFGGASWDEGGIIAHIDGALKRVPENPGGSPIALIDDWTNETNERFTPLWPHILPGGTHVLYTAVGSAGPDDATLEVLALADLTRTPLQVRGTFGRYLDGNLLYIRQGALYAVPFDLKLLEARRPEALVLDRVAYSAVFGYAQVDVSRSGRLIYRRSPPLLAAWLDRGGTIEPLPLKPGPYMFPRLSPKGESLAINVRDSSGLRTDVYDIKLNQTSRLPFAPGSFSPVWHPEGFLVLGGRGGMSWMKPGMLKVETLTQSPNAQIPWSFTGDGTRLTYFEHSPSTFLDLWTVPTGHAGGKLTARVPEAFLQTQNRESFPSLSPDKQWMAYGAGQHPNWEVYVRPFPRDGSAPIEVSQGGGRIARWLPNGHEIVYRTDDHRLMVVDYQVKNGRFVPGKPRELTPTRLGDTGVVANFDVHGDRIIALVPESGVEAERIRNQATVMPRFAEEVQRRLAPAGK